jgi:3-phosphoshikimate 1-carboxyvinyltransferase
LDLHATIFQNKMPNVCSVSWNRKSLKTTVHLPSSKSISNRLLIIKALSEKNFSIKNLSEADDTKLLQELLYSKEKILDAENAGTCFRFLTAYLAQKEGEWILTGSERMKQRPIGALVDALKNLGADIKCLEKENYPPLAIRGKKLNGTSLEMNASESSQFVSALLLIAPYINGGLKLKLTGDKSSTPYINMTLSLMKQSGIKILNDGSVIEIPQQEYTPKDYMVESDWSSAAFWYAMAALCNNADVSLKSLETESVQGDAVIIDWISAFNVETHFVKDGVIINHHKKTTQEKYLLNFSQHPDLAPAMFVLCAALGVEATFSGIKKSFH